MIAEVFDVTRDVAVGVVVALAGIALGMVVIAVVCLPRAKMLRRQYTPRSGCAGFDDDQLLLRCEECGRDTLHEPDGDGNVTCWDCGSYGPAEAAGSAAGRPALSAAVFLAGAWRGRRRTGLSEEEMPHAADET